MGGRKLISNQPKALSLAVIFDNLKITMNLVGQTVKIIVSEPWEWTEGNLFGEILSEQGDEQILVKLTKTIKGSKLTSDLIELRTRYEKETFKPLTKQNSITVGGSLVEQNSNKFDYIIIGSVIID